MSMANERLAMPIAQIRARVAPPLTQRPAKASRKTAANGPSPQAPPQPLPATPAGGLGAGPGCCFSLAQLWALLPPEE